MAALICASLFILEIYVFHKPTQSKAEFRQVLSVIHPTKTSQRSAHGQIPAVNDRSTGVCG